MVSENDNLLDLSDNKSSDLKSANSNVPINSQTTINNNQEIQPNAPVQRQVSESDKIELKPKIDITQIPKETQETIIENPIPTGESTPKKSSLWKIILIILIVCGLGFGGYYLYTKYFVSPEKQYENKLEKYKIGPNLDIFQKDTLNFFDYSSILNLIVFQKSNFEVFGDNLTLDTKDYPMLETYSAELISISPDGRYLVVYFPEKPAIQDSDSPEVKLNKEKFKDSAENYYLVDLEKNNDFYELGQYLTYFTWGKNNLYFMNNSNELWTYDIKLANYIPPVYQGPVELVYKITDINFPIYDIEYNNSNDLIYLILGSIDNKNSSLNSLDTTTKKISKIFDTTSNTIDFSPYGKYYALIDIMNQNIHIYNIENNQLFKTISNESVASDSNIQWSLDEKNIYYFISNSNMFEKTEDLFINIGNYNDLIQYNLETNIKNILLSGKEKNIADVTNYILSVSNNSFYIMTNQNNNIYKFDLK